MKTGFRKFHLFIIMALMIALMIPVSASAAVKTVKRTSVTISAGKSKTVKVSGKVKAKWTTTNKNIASISSKNSLSTKITGKKAGSATVTAKITSGKTTSQYIWKVTVKKAGSSTAAATGSATSTDTSSSVSSSGIVSPLKAGVNETLPSKVSGTDKAATYYNKMMALKKKAASREGAAWSNATYRSFSGQNDTDCTWGGGYGCAGFAMMLSDAAFGKAQSKKSTDLNTVKVGDMVVFNDGKPTVHWVMVMKVVKTSAGKLDYLVVAEGNYTNSGLKLKNAVHWGRVIPASRCYTSGQNFSFLVTRY